MATAENTDPNRTVSAESAKEFERLQNAKAKTTDPTDPSKKDFRLKYISALKTMLPEHQYVDDSWLLLELRDSDSLQKEVTGRIIEQEKKSNPQLRNRWESDDPDDQEWRVDYQKNIIRNIKSNLNTLSYDGETVRKNITDHHYNLVDRSKDYQINNIGGIVKNDPEKYADYVDPEDIKNNNINETTIQSLFEKDKDFRRMVIEDKIEEFDNQLDNKANEGVYNINRNPDEYAKAYAVYNKYGSEALTDYTNIYQHYDPEGVVQDRRVIDAFRRFKKAPRFKDDNPFDHAKNFIGGQKQLSLNSNDDLYRYQNTIQKAAQEHELDPALLSAVIQRESIDAAKIRGVSPETIDSSAGAIGMGQLMADTARDMGLRVDDEVDEREDPVKNINASAKYLAKQLKDFDGDTKLALAAYNAGPEAAKKILMKAKEKGTQDITKVISEDYYPEPNGYIPAVLDYRSKFSKEKTETANPLTFTPRKEIERKPKDYNPLTEQLYYTPENKIAQSSQQKTINFLNKGLESLGADFEIESEQLKSYDANTNIAEAIEQGKPVPLVETFEFLQHQHSDRLDVPSYKEFAYELVRKVMGEKDGMQHLITTLAANNVNYRETEEGTGVYELSMKELEKPGNQYLKVLVDGLRLQGDQVMSIKGDTIEIEPKKQFRRNLNRSNVQISDIGMGAMGKTIPGLFGAFDVPLFEKELRMKTDESGRITGFEEHMPNNMWNTAAGAVLSFTDIMHEAYGGIVGGWGGNLMKAVDAPEGVIEFLDEQRHKSRDFYAGMTGEFSDPVIGQFSAADLGTAGGMLAGYLLNINMLGGKMLSGAGKIAKGVSKLTGRGSATAEHLRQAAGARKLMNFKNWYKGASKSSSQGAKSLRNAYNAISNGKRYAVWPKYTIGAAGIETFTDPEYSIAMFADTIIQDAVLGLKEENKWNIERNYKTGGAVGRWFTDFLAGEMLGVLFDGMIGVGKLAKDYSWMKMRDKPALGLEYDSKIGNYKPEQESRYYQESPSPGVTAARKYLFPDIQRFVFNIRNNVENIPVGDIRDSAQKYARMASVGPHMYEEGVEATQADIAAKFVQDSNEFMGTFRQDLRQIIEDVNERYGGHAKMDSKQIDQLTRSVENDFMETVAKGIHEFTGEGRNFNSTKFAEMLEGHPAPLEDVTPLARNGKSVLNRTEATIVSKQNPGSYVIQAGENQFKVFKPDASLWRFDLANRLRQLDGSLSDLPKTIDSHLAKFELDVNREADFDKVGKVIETLESTHDTVVRTPEGREGVISGFNQHGWTVKWGDGTEKVYGEIRGLEGVPEKPPQIVEPVKETEVTGQQKEFDEQGLEVESGENLRASQKPDEDVNILDLRSPERLMRELGEEARARRQQELEEVFRDPEEQVASRIDRVKELMREGNHEEAEEVIREISEIRQGPQSRGEAREMPGIVDMRAIVEADRQAYLEARGRAEEPTDLDRLHTFHYDRLKSTLSAGGREGTVTQDIQMLRGMGMTKQAMDELINENFAGRVETQQYLRNYNRSIDFAQGTTDELLRARVNESILENIRDEAFRDLPDKVKKQMVEQADRLANASRTDSPQKLISQSDEEVSAFRSWETANEPFKPARPNNSGLTGKEYAQALAEDLGTDNIRSIAKLQKTQSGGKNKVEIRGFDGDSVVGENGEVKKIKNSKGLVVRVEPSDGQLPFYAIGRKNNIKSFPTRFETDQNGKLMYNSEWAFINPNVTMRPDGTLRRFKTIELPNGDMAYREDPTGKYILNVQNPERVDWYDYMGRWTKDSTGKKHIQPAKDTHEILTPTKIFRKNVDAVETTHPRTGQKVYRPVAPEQQALLHGKEVSTGGDARTPHVFLQTEDVPKNPLEYLPKFSKMSGGSAKAHAWLAIPGMMFTGTTGMDENGDLTPFGKAALAIGALAMGGVMIRSMTGQFKIRNAYDNLDPKYRQTFDKFDWYNKIGSDGTPVKEALTDDESAMFNRLQGVPKDDYKLLHDITARKFKEDVRGTSEPIYKMLQDADEYIGPANKRIPELTGETSIIKSDDYINWSTGFREDGTITPQPSSAREHPSDEVILLELDENSQGLVSRSRPVHEFADKDVSFDEGIDMSKYPEGTTISEASDLRWAEKYRRPVSWSRLRKAPDGRILLDELQVDNAIQKGKYGATGDVTRDLYTPVLDDVVERALQESDGEFYITRGHMQSARYGDDADTIRTRKRARQQVFERGKQIQEKAPEPIIREAETIEQAREFAGTAYRLEDADVRTELGRVLKEFESTGVDRNELLDNIANIERYERLGVRNFNVEAVKGGYKLGLNDEGILKLAAKQVHEESELFRNMFPRHEEFYQFTKDGTKTKGLLQFYDNTLPNIIKKRYGAEVSYAKGDPKKVYDSADEAFHRIKVTPEGLEKAKGKTPKRVNWETVGGSMGLAGLAASAYAMEGIGDTPDEDMGTEQVQQAGLGTLTLVLLGAMALGRLNPRIKTKVGGYLKGKVKGKVHNNVDNVAAKTVELDGKKFSMRDMHDLDISFNPVDEASVDATQKWWKRLNVAIKSGKEAGRAFKFGSLTQAGTQLLKSVSETIKTRTGSRSNTIFDKVNDFILDANQQPSRIRRTASVEFNENVERVDENGNITHGYGRGAFKKFPHERGPQIVKQTFDSEVNDDNARKFFNDAAWRIMNRGIRKVGRQGAVSRDVPDHVKAAYEGENGDLYRSLDQKLLQNEEFVDYVNSLRKSYDQVGNRYLRLMKGELDRNLSRLSQTPMKTDSYTIKQGDSEKIFTHDDLVNIAHSWTRDHPKKSFSEFRKTLPKEERHLLRIAKKESDQFQRLMQVQNVRSRFTDLRGKYFPQMVDHDKVAAIRERLVARAEEQGLENPENWAYYQMLGQWREVNNVGDARGLIGFNPEKLDIGLSDFESADDAVIKLKAVINSSEEGVQDQFYEHLGSRRLTPQLMEDLGFVIRDTNDNGEQVFRLRQPEDFNPSVEGMEHNIFDVANMENFKKYYNTAMMDPALRRSKFLENPRKFNLPQSWSLTDPQKAFHKYSVDTGYRLHALEYGLYEAEDFVRNYLTPMQNAMKNTGFDEAMINRVYTRTDDIFKKQWGIVSELAGKSPHEVEQYIKNKKNTSAYLQTFRNLNYAKYAYGFKYLDWFQPMISTMAFTSGRAMKQAFGIGEGAVPYEGIRQLEDIITDANVIKEKDMSFRFDQNQLDPTGDHGSVSGYLQSGSQKMADRLSSFSIEKWALDLMGVDVGNKGRGFRLMTDSFHGNNSLQTTHNAYAFMAESAHFARVAREMQNAGIGMDQTFKASDGKTYNWQQVYDKLEDLGISKTKDVVVQDGAGGRKLKEVDYFIEQENQLQRFISGLKNNERVSINDFDPAYADIIERQWHFATETYHGTNKAMRPEKWNTQLGRTLAQFGSFTYNIGMQVTRKRLLDPMNRWIDRFATNDEGLQQIGKIQMPLLMKHIRSGNEDALRKLGVTDPKRAIAEFPIESISTMWRVMGGIGFSIATYTTLDIMRDIYAAPVNAALGEDQFQRTKERFTGPINPYAPKDEQVTLTELFGGDDNARDVMRLLAWSAGQFGQSSYGGMYASPFESITKYGYRGVGSLVPVLGMTDRMASDAISLMKPIGMLNPEELPGETAKFLMNNLPIISSNVFTEARESARTKINEYRRELRNSDDIETTDREPFVRYR